MSSATQPPTASTQQTEFEPTALVEALDWLHTAPGGAQPHTDKDGPLLDLVPLRKHLRAIGGLQLAPMVLLRILDLFEARVMSINEILMPILLDATLALPRHLRIVSHGLIDVHGELAQRLLQVINQGGDVLQSEGKYNIQHIAARALVQLELQYVIALHISSSLPRDLWRHVVVLEWLSAHAHGRRDNLSNDNPAEAPLKRMLALAAAQTDSLTPRELNFLLEYLRIYAPALQLSSSLPSVTDQQWFWLDDSGERAPTAVAKRPPGDGNRVLFYSCSTLADLLRQQLEQLLLGVAPQTLNLPLLAGRSEYHGALQHALRLWSEPPQRAHLRRRSNYRAQFCIHLGKLWYLLQGEDIPDGLDADTISSEWMVINETVSGYAAMHVSGPVLGLLAGTAIGVRSQEGGPWSICIVRWAHSDNPEHLEIGLEILAPRAQAVRILTAGSKSPKPALLLPALDAIDRGESILTTSGQLKGERFTLLIEAGERVQIVECQTKEVIERTASIEVCEFNRLELAR